MGDGHLNICIECKKAYQAGYSANNKEKVIIYDRARGLTKKRRARASEYSRRNRDLMLWYGRIWGMKNRHKKRAHLLVHKAIKVGALCRQPCEVCGKTKSEAHHDDYSAPLRIRWLCRGHHVLFHRTNGDYLKYKNI